ncbi:MAG: hypothetical protein WA864_31820 [Acetobacteraceae bacterium]
MDAYQRECDILEPCTDLAAAPQGLGTSLTLGGLMAAASVDLSITRKQLDNELSALRRLASALGHEPSTVELSGDPSQFEHLLRRLASAPRPITGRTLRNIRSRCRSAFRRFVKVHSIVPPAAPVSLPWPTAWQGVADAFPPSKGFSPKRFITYAVENHWGPSDVLDAIVERYATTLADLKHPRPHLSRLIAGWNIVAAEAARGLSKLAPLPPIRQPYSPSLDELSPELRADMHAYFDARRVRRRASIHDTNPLPDLEQTSIDKAERLLRQFLGLLRRQGTDISVFKHLADVVTLDHVGAVTNAELDRTDDVPSSQLRNMLITVSGMARHWTGMPEEDLDRLVPCVVDSAADP